MYDTDYSQALHITTFEVKMNNFLMDVEQIVPLKVPVIKTVSVLF